VLWDRTRGDDGLSMERGSSETLAPIRATPGVGQPRWATGPALHTPVTSTAPTHQVEATRNGGSSSSAPYPPEPAQPATQPPSRKSKKTKKHVLPSSATEFAVPSQPTQKRVPSMPIQVNNTQNDTFRNTPTSARDEPAQPHHRQASATSSGTGPPGSFGNPVPMRVPAQIPRPDVPIHTQITPTLAALPMNQSRPYPYDGRTQTIDRLTLVAGQPTAQATSSSSQLPSTNVPNSTRTTTPDLDPPALSSFDDLVRSNVLPLTSSTVNSSIPPNTTQYYAMRCHELRAAIKRMTTGAPLRSVTKEELLFWSKLCMSEKLS
jgi:hypothetical protein